MESVVGAADHVPVDGRAVRIVALSLRHHGQRAAGRRRRAGRPEANESLRILKVLIISNTNWQSVYSPSFSLFPCEKLRL